MLLHMFQAAIEHHFLCSKRSLIKNPFLCGGLIFTEIKIAVINLKNHRCEAVMLQPQTIIFSLDEIIY